MNRDIKWWQVITLFIIIAGVILTVWSAQQQDQFMRSDLLIKIAIAKTGIPTEEVISLNGSIADLTSLDYQLLKAQLEEIRASDPGIRFAYLMGLRRDGTIIIYVDSESPESADYSPPGQIYNEASVALKSVFATGKRATEGPSSDRWGTWVSGFIPVTDPETGEVIAVFGMDIDATNWNWEISRASLPTLLATLLILLLVLASALFQQHNRKEQQRLESSEEKFSRAFHANPALMALSTIKEGRFLDVNTTFLKTLGYSREEVIGRSDSDLNLFFDPAQRDTIVSQLKETGQVRDLMVKLYRKDHELLDGLFSASTIDIAAGPQLLTVILDLTERKRAEEEVIQTRHNFETFFDTIDDFLYVLDEQGLILHTNATVNRRLLYTNEELLSQHVLIVHPPDRRDEAGRIIQEMLAGKTNFCPVPLITSDGHLIPVETRVTRGEWNGRPVLFGVSKDITQLKLSEEKFSMAFQTNASLMALSREQDGEFIDVNDAFLETLGFSRDEVIGKSVSDLGLFEQHNDRSNILRMLEEKGKVRNIEVQVKTKNGAIRYGLFSVDRIMIGDLPCLLTTLADITERKQAEAARLIDIQRTKSLLALSSMIDQPFESVIAFAVEEAIRLTGSKIGYLALLSEDETVMTIQYWSRSVHDICKVMDKPLVYQVEKTGLWGESVRQRRPIVTNDYAAHSPHKRGTPDGHVPIKRHLNIPVFDGDRIVAVAGVGNKPSDYDDGDIGQLQLLMNGWWQIVTRKRASEALRLTNTILSTQTEASIDGILVVDESGKIVSFNNRFIEIWGISSEVIASQSDERALKSVLDNLVDPKEFLLRVNYLYEHRNENSREEINLLDNRTLDRYSAPMIGSDGKYYGRVWNFRDITERKHQEEHLRLINECLLNFGPDPRGNINKLTALAGEVLHGDYALYSRLEEGRLCSLGTWHTPHDYSPCNDPHGQICSDVIQRGSNDVVYIPDLQKTNYDQTDANVAHNSLKTYLGVAVRTGREILGSLCVTYTSYFLPTSSDEEILSMIAAAVGMEEERKKAIDQLKDFAYIVSHDLKAPLRGISSLAQWLHEDYSDHLDEEGLKSLNLMVARVSRMQSLIDGILAYSRIGRTPEVRVQISVRNLVEEVIDTLHPPDGLTIHIPDKMPTIMGDKTQITQVFENLISNAIKYIGRPDGVISILAEQLEDHYQFGVRDNGPGIDPRYHEKVFVIFQTLHRRSDIESTGVGLTIAKKIVEHMGGRIWIESDLGFGTTFLFTIPVSRDEPADLGSMREIAQDHK